MKKLLLFLVLFGLTLGVVGCVNNTTSTTSAHQITLETPKTEILIAIASTYQLTYSLLGTTPSDSTVVSFQSSDSNVASVSSTGLIHGENAGTCEIVIRYNESVFVGIQVTVSSGYTVIPPVKTQYQLGDTLSLYGAAIEIRDDEGTLQNTITITKEMISNYDPELTGSQIVEFVYEGVTYGFEIFILNEKQSASLFADFVLLNTTVQAGEKLEFMLTQADVVNFLDKIENVYDYSEIKIYGLFTQPDKTVAKVNAFWYQEFEEQIQYTTVNPSRNLEGTVANTDDDYDLILTYVKSSNPQYRLRYLPKLTGDYHCELIVEVDGRIIQTIKKDFSISEMSTDYLGFLQVDRTNNRHFVFDNGETYVPVGQNVAWYTSADRKYYDYLNWFDKMKQNNMNYARVWMAAWGFSIFWDDIENYDERQDNMKSLDRTIEIADEFDIYIQLCILHHGMFSATVNPMWPNTINTWYTNKYGSNPYALYLSNSGLFFTSDFAKQNFKNQLDYIIARWGYSDNIMSFELFNEVDWVETYSAVSGTAWHKEMAAYIKANDVNQHMVTTSVKSDSFLSNTYKVFALDEIDYVNVHSYGIAEHLKVLPTKQNNGFEIFNKPIMYNEIGYSGNGGADQYSKDPANITLRQGLWAGAMGGGGGTGMNWWWESWIEPYDAYDEYQGVAKYLENVNLSGDNYQVIAKNDIDYHLATVSSSIVDYMGYIVDNRIYVYLYDNGYSIYNPFASSKSNVSFTVPGIEAGTYRYTVYNTLTGESVTSSEITQTTTGNLVVTLPTFSIDTAIIIEPLN